jgi:Domain of unknown function (DUF4279)
MAHLHRSAASLRIYGASLDPEEISRTLNCVPTKSLRNGHIIPGSVTGREHVQKVGMWSLAATDREPENLDAQVAALLEKLPGDLAMWRALSERYKVDLFVGLFMKETNEGFSLSPETLRALAERSIELAVDVYAL